MTPRVLTALAVGAALIAACDVSQKTPQTGHLPAGTALVPALGEAAPVPGEVHAAPLGGGGAAIAGEKSIRLYGPGVSRKRQTRV